MDEGIALLFGAFIILVIGTCLGSCHTDNSWRDKLVDRPGYIAAIKSSVLAEREAARLLSE